jgi:hypothetical protein
VPAYLLTDVKEYGDTGKIVTEALKIRNTDRFSFELREILSLIKKNIESLELWRDNGPIGEEGEIDQYYLQMLEMYKSIYFTIKESRLLRKRPQKKEDV